MLTFDCQANFFNQVYSVVLVGDSVTVHRDNEVTGVVDTGKPSTVPGTVAKVTWADIAKKAPAAGVSASTIATCGGSQSASRHQNLRNHRTFVLRSLSQNNPVNASKV